MQVVKHGARNHAAKRQSNSPSYSWLRSSCLFYSKYTTLAKVFDTHNLLRFVRSFGIEAEIVTYTEDVHGLLECNWIATLDKADPEIASLVLKAFKPR